MKTASEDRFFIGWSSRVPRALLPVVVAAIVLVPMLFAGFGVLLGLAADDPGDALVRIGERGVENRPVRPEDWAGDQVFRGRLETRGYSLLHVPPDAAYPRGRTLLLSGEGKRGPQTNGYVGPAELRGGLLRRGTIEMLVGDELTPLGSDVALPEPVRTDLGRWRVTGEICDGKCYPGGMRPGHGLSHRACANLCLSGNIPPILVTASPVAGSSFLVIATPGRDPPYGHLAGFVSGLVEMEGRVERVNNILMLHLDPASLKRR